MTNKIESESDEPRIAALMRTLDTNTLPPDATVLEALRIEAAAKFEQAEIQLPITTPQHTRSKPMITLLASRSLATIVAIASAIALWFNVSPTSSALSATPFSKVLSELRGANTLQLKVSKDGVTANVLVRAPGLVRWEESPQKYQIAAGSRLWKIDESQNTATESDSPWFVGPQEQIDLLGLLDAGVSDASRLLDARPVERSTRDGRDCLIYRVALPAGDGRVDVEAATDAKNLQLVEILAWKSGSKRTDRPLAEMQLVAMNMPVADEKFAVSKSLTEDGRIGTVSDAQGIVVLRPMLAKRWTPICRETLLRPGDWIRTELRGANAIKVRLSSDVEITLGPGTLLECMSPTEARLHTGAAQVYSPTRDLDATKEFSLLAPRDGKRIVKSGEKLVVRIDRNEKLVEVAQTPAWLTGFEGTSNNESLGSLIVTLPDGRNEPLTVGYHKVSVEIRDQIARTTIEESFVNHTAGRLEGVFHFPLPQDASISGFGMWIGDDLVEADVVEKQRAREIYETILREKRDPGLLEWTGGNIFKARVFPIEARSEKRIKIVYTQVLPLRANRYRYSYGLRSELLRTSPLRELSLTVTVHSALALKSVTCPTHAARTQLTEHSAQVEFAAQEYSPTRDFEVVCEVDGRQNDVVVIPHRRGDDGYFLMQLTPPGSDGNWQRNVLPDGAPLNLVLLCDTSMSMDSEKRREQAEFVAAVLASLGPDDRFQLVAADVEPVWASAEPMVANAENIATASKFLSDRVSLGWTDLDRAFGDVLNKAPANANIVYIGDGILSAGDTDPAAFVKRLAKLASGGRQSPDDGVRRSHEDESKRDKNHNQGVNTPRSPKILHTVTVGNSNDSVVMRGIATVSGGSVRTISGEQTPQIAALELLNEIAQPGLRDLKVEFRGVKVAAVYPEQLPNVAAGTQQILVGRYLPEGKDQQGEIIVSGKRGLEDVRYVAKVNLKEAEEGNSFIARLWARSRLDQLLAQGGSQAVQDDIIRLSEEFHIITPYTSLLVLETDADRERFGVQRRYEMRDGERFFADGRDNANFDLLQAQMTRAGDWRTGMRRTILNGLAGLGRDADVFQQQVQQFDQVSRSSGLSAAYPTSGPMGSASSTRGGVSNFLSFSDSGGFEDEFEEMRGGLGGGFGGGFADQSPGKLDRLVDLTRDELGDDSDELQSNSNTRQLLTSLDEPSDSDFKTSADKFVVDEDLLIGMSDESKSERSRKQVPLSAAFDGESAIDGPFAFSKAKKYESVDLRFGKYVGRFGRGSNQPDYTSWINILFPSLPQVSVVAEADSPPVNWSPAAIELANSLLRIESLLAFDGGIELRKDTETLDPRWNRSTGRSLDQVLYSASAWLTRGNNVAEQTIVNYCDASERSAYSLAFGLGSSRASVDRELKSPPLDLNDSSLLPLQKIYAAWTTTVEAAGENQTTLIMTMKDNPTVVKFTIDTARHVILKHEVITDNKMTSTTTFSDFVEIAGSWWARRIVPADDQGKSISDTRLEITSLTKDEYAQRLQQQLSDKPTVQLIHQPFVSLQLARQKIADGTATFDDQLAMILHNAQLQQWDDMWKHVDAAEKLAVNKPGVRWLRTVLLATIRRNEEARQGLIEEGQKLSQNASQDEVFLAEFILGQAYGVTAWPEFYALHQLLKPVYTRAMEDRIPAVLPSWPDDAVAEQRARSGMSQRIIEMWNQREASSLEQLGRREDALQMWRTLAESSPWNAYAQQVYAERLEISGEFTQAQAWLLKELARPERSASDDELLRTAVVALLRKQGKWNELQAWTSAWIAQNPETSSYYSAYMQHLSAMICNDHLDDAYALADTWLQEARVEGKLTNLQKMRLEAALNFANGQLPDLQFHSIDERWYERLAETARFFARHPDHFDIVSRCTANYNFQQSDIADQLRGEWLTMLRNEAATLSITQLNSFVAWTVSGRMALTEPLDDHKQLDASEVPNRIWADIAATMKDRWLKFDNKDQKRLLSDSLVSIYAIRFRTKLLPFLREQMEAATADETTSPEERSASITLLFNNLKIADWSSDIEPEALTVLQQLSPASEPIERLSVELPALYRLVDAMLTNRLAAAKSQLQDQGELDKLTRKELAEKMSEIRSAARKELSVRLAVAASAAEIDELSKPLAAWFRMEQIWLDVQRGEKLAEAETACWQTLGETPPKLDETDEISETLEIETISSTDARRQFFEMQLKRRAFATVMNLAVRSKAAAASVDRLLKYVDAGIATGGDAAAPWRKTKFQLLVALDRPDDLERELNEWIRDDVSTAPWRQMLARLLAERGKLDQAIALFKACEKDKLLTSSSYRMLADWYLVSNRRSDYERCRIESFKQMPEQMLNQLLYQTQNRWSRNDIPLPSELSDDTLFALRALFEKSANPESYFYQVRSLYGACRDFRLLKILPDAVLGRSPQQVYTFLKSLEHHAFLQGPQETVLSEMLDEATADEILARVKQLREGERTATDLRALDLLEAIVERRSSDVLNQPGPHVDACLAAMQRAFLREWADGEPQMMATFLYQLGKLPNEKLRAEQLRELRELQKASPAASRDHLSITLDLSELLFKSYEQQDDALGMLEVEVRGYIQANGGQWPFADLELLDRYCSLLESANQFLFGEKLIKTFLSQPVNESQREWLQDRLMSLYNNALEDDGAVSIGTGRKELFSQLITMILKDLDAASNENKRYNVVSQLTTTLSIGHRNELPQTKAAVQKFAFEILPQVLKLQEQQYRNTVTQPVQLIRDVLGAQLCLQYVVERMEQYPQRFEGRYENSWTVLGGELAASRAAAGSTNLDDRVLKIALNRLHNYLTTGDSSHMGIFYHGYNEFWREKTADFAAAAEAVLKERRSSGRRAMSVAQYIRNGLANTPRAIEILHIAHSDGQLDQSEQHTLATWLREANRYAEMIPIMEPLVKHYPNSMQYRTELMAAYFHSQRPEQLQKLIEQTEKHFHKDGLWTEFNVAQFANGCVGVSDWKRVKQYMTEAIALHQRANSNSGLNDNTLSQYYQNLATAESALGNTKDGATAAMSSIVCWSSRHEYRQYAINSLRSVLNASKDLDAFVAQLDAEAAQSGQDNPILRKAIGQTYQNRNEYVKAITQFNLALELQPNDKETYQALIACYDTTENKPAASAQLRKLIDLQPHDLELYKQLAERMKDNSLEAERAATSILESSPNEAQSHAAMAELRQNQDRWAEAIPHWEQVARYRKLEPTGLLKLAEAQIHEQQFSEARASLQTLQHTAWPSRFGDVEAQIRQLQERLPK